MHPIRWSINRKLQQIRPKFTNLRNQCDSHNRAANIKYSIPYIGANPPTVPQNWQIYKRFSMDKMMLMKIIGGIQSARVQKKVNIFQFIQPASTVSDADD